MSVPKTILVAVDGDTWYTDDRDGVSAIIDNEGDDVELARYQLVEEGTVEHSFVAKKGKK
jgi:hypothetical protein